MTSCGVSGCPEPYRAKGYCAKHYKAMRRGDPQAVEKHLEGVIQKAKMLYGEGTFIPDSRLPMVYGDVCYILLNTGEIALCDASDYSLVSAEGRKWLSDRGYASFMRTISGRREKVFLHRLLRPEWAMVDHRNGNRLDNRSVNLRECTNRQNLQNSTKRAKTSSRYKGVSWSKRYGKWETHVRIPSKKSHTFLGYFSSEEEAARAYDAKARELFGEFARLNFPTQKSE